ncbi:hypothetical protein [Methylovorus sp. MP688]|uniref:hypothetical protein n=1 Tax=Methylovorus sp. (strain MP688) TaxID=887061 RepID=UPI0011D16976|nr:hypothetical protein [Methylovorus sp. MP688]
MKILSFFLIFFSLIDSSYSSSFSNENLSSPVGSYFLNERNRLLSKGWQPKRMHRVNEYDYIGFEKYIVNKKFYELESCSVDNKSFCIFNYVKGDKCLRITTEGEEFRSLRVISISSECAPDDAL